MHTTLHYFLRSVPGVAAKSLFAEERAAILSDLQANVNDKSLAAKVDVLMLDLVSLINTKLPQYVTTSSCSGRVSLFHRAVWQSALPREQTRTPTGDDDRSDGHDASSKPGHPVSCPPPPPLPNATRVVRRKRGDAGKGTLYSSHDPCHDIAACVRDQLIPALSQFWQWRHTAACNHACHTRHSHHSSELLHIKFEPMILHVRCADMDAAAALLQCASEAAQGDSGVLSCSRGTRDYRKITCCITSPLCFDIPLFVVGSGAQTSEEDSLGVPRCGSWLLGNSDFDCATWRALLSTSMCQANYLFAENSVRRERFVRELKKRLV